MTVATFINTVVGAKYDQVDTGSNTGVSTTLPWTPGFPASGNYFSDWIYVKASSDFSGGATVADGDVVILDKDFNASRLTNTTAASGLGKFLGVIRAANTINQGNGFWVQVCGQCNLNITTGNAAYTALNSSTTAGRLTTTTSAGVNYKVVGMVGNATAASNLAEATINYPQLGAQN